MQLCHCRLRLSCCQVRQSGGGVKYLGSLAKMTLLRMVLRSRSSSTVSIIRDGVTITDEGAGVTICIVARVV